jgi:hypothetical protein
MASTFKRRLRQIRRTVTYTWSDMDYAQRRLFEIRTGTADAGALERARNRAMINELEAHWRS